MSPGRGFTGERAAVVALLFGLVVVGVSLFYWLRQRPRDTPPAPTESHPPTFAQAPAPSPTPTPIAAPSTPAPAVVSDTPVTPPRSRQPAALAAVPPRRLQNFSKQEPGSGEATPMQREGLAALERRVPQVSVQFDPITGAPSSIISVGRFLTAPVAPGADAAAVVRQFVGDNAALFGHDAAPLRSSRVTRDDVTAHNGMRTLVWQQQVDGIPVYNTVLKANVTRDGAIVSIGSLFMSDATAATQMTAGQRAALIAQPPVDGNAAVSLAAADIGETVNAPQVASTSASDGSERKQSFSAPSLSDVVARLSWLPMNATTARLAWDVTLMSKRQKAMYQTLVDVQTGEVLLRRSLTADISNASYRVYADGTSLQPFDSPTPMSPGLSTPASTQPPTVSRNLITTPALDTTASPNGWIDDGGTATYGNNVDAHLDTGNTNPGYGTGTHATSATRNFDFTLDLTQDPSTYQSAAITDLFYACNYYHDKLYALGFTESAGNFQQNNFGKGGAGNDAVLADAQDGSGTDNANFSTPADGSPGRMQMYIFTGPSPRRDGDLDMEVVFHEHTHGLSNRLVGGGVGISALQPSGMGEGWSDFYALCLLSQPADDVNGTYAAGAYVSYQLSGLTQNYYYGIRRYPYTTDMTKNPLTLKDIDPTKASAHTGIPLSPISSPPNVNSSEVHNQGEVWCVTLWDVRASLVAKLGAVAGNQMALQLVTDGMKLSPANPTFLQARDAIIQADVVDNAGANKNQLWSAFSKRGMGASATVPANSTTTGVVEAYDFPDNLGVTPSAVFASSGQIGGPFSPSSQTYTLTNSGASSLNWTAAVNQTWLSVSPASGALAAGASIPVTVTINANAASLTAGNYSGVTSFTNATSGAVLTRQAALAITPPRIAYFPLDTDPGWTRQGEWAFGKPTGAGGTSFGNHDPTTGATGTNAFGINLTGDYSTTVGGPYYLTTSAINLAGYTGTQLRFKRWLNCDYPPYVYETIQVSNDGANWTTVFTNPSGTPITDSAWTPVQYDISSVADKHSTVYIRWGHQIASTGAFAYSGWNIDDVEILGSPSQALVLSLSSGTVTEGSAPVTATLNITPAPATDSLVSLSSSDTTSATVPPTVTIPAGQTSVTFPVTILDDALLNGTRSVTLTATLAGYNSGTTALIVNDNETATLGVTAPTPVSEIAGTVQGSVTVNTAPVNAVTVSLSSSDTTALQVPATVVIPAGQTSANFAITIIDDNKINGTHNATITAHVANWTDGSATVAIQDNEGAVLSVVLPSSVVESGGATGTVSTSGTLSNPLTVTFTSSNTARLSNPSSVTIPAGSTSATFLLSAPDNFVTDGTANVTVTASASGFTNGSSTINVLDNDVHHFAVSAIGASQVRGVPFSVTISAKDINGVTMSSYAGTPSLSAAGTNGADSISPLATSTFSAGVWTGNVTVNSFDTAVVLAVDDGAGHTGASNTFNVSVGALQHFAWNTVPTPQTKNTPFNVTVTAQDAGNNTVTGFSGTTTLSASTFGSSGASIVITELDTSDSDAIEFTNVSGAARDISGWKITAYDWNSWPAPSVTFTVPAGTTCPANQTFLLREAGTSPGAFPTFYTATNIFWNNNATGNPVALLLQDAAGNIVDFVCAFDAVPSQITSPVTIPAAQWNTAPLAANTVTTKTYQRTGNADNNGSGDWVVATGTLATLNAGLVTPFPGAGVSTPITPTVSGSFVNGVWTGSVAVLQGATQVRLRADDGAAHTGDSNFFDVIGNSPTAATASATSVASTTATLNGAVNPNAASTAVSFDYGLTTSYGSTIAATPSPVTGNSSVNVSAALTGLASGTTYHFRVNATNAFGNSVGNDFTFTTTSNNANLSNLVLSTGTLSPVFSSSTTSYTATVPYAVSSITVTPTTAAGGATIKVNGIAVTSGNPSGAISLAVGANSISTIVTASDGVTTKTYSVTVTRAAASTNANLSNLVLLTGILNPAFSTNTTTYTVGVPNSISVMTVTPTVADTTATVKVNGVAVASGAASGPITLAAGANSINVIVTAESGATKTYTIVVTRGYGTIGFASSGPLNSARSSQATVLLGNGKVLVAGGLNGSALATAELYDSTTGIWAATGSMGTGRYQCTGTLLPNGKALIVGGLSSSGAIASCELYDPATGLWTATGSLHSPRRLHNAVLMPNGKVLVTAGFNTSALATAEIYDPATGQWTVTGSMSTARYFGAATLLTTGKVLVAGGIATSGAATATTELYDPAAGTWTAAPVGLQTARYYLTLTALPDGRALAAGGYDGTSILSSAEFYTPSSNSWSLAPSMNTARQFHTASLLPNGNVLVAGGVGNTTEIYDFSLGYWIAAGPLTATHSQHTATMLPSGKLLIAGGAGTVTETYDYAIGTMTNTPGSMATPHAFETLKLLPTGKVLVAGSLSNSTVSELFNPATGTWSSTGSMLVGVSQSAAVMMANGNVLVAGGYSGSAVSSVQIYNPGTGGWSSTANLSVPRMYHSGTLLQNGKILVAGGSSLSSTYYTSAEIYDPATAKWSATGAMLAARNGHSAVLLPNGKVLIAGGSTSTTLTTEAELYDPSTGTWSTTGSLSTVRNYLTLTLLPNGKVLAAGGLAPGSALTSAELYNPATGTWSATGSLAVGRYYHTATLLPSGKVLVTGGNTGHGDLASAEIYDPATGTWSAGPNLNVPRSAASAAVLPNGKVLIAGGPTSSTVTEWYDPGLGYNASWQAQIISPPASLAPGDNLSLAGTGFTGLSGASSGSFQDSPSNYPVVRLSALENGQTAFLFSNPNAPWSASSFTSTGVPGLPFGYAMATIFTNGIPSTAVLVNVVPSANADLSGLLLSSGTLAPVFASATTSYTASVSNATGTITLTPTTANAGATIKVNTAVVLSGAASPSINLVVGDNTVTTLVTAQDGTTSKTYSIAITRRTPYQDWATAQGLDATALDPMGDFNHSGLKNLLKWAFSTNTTSNSLATISVSGGVLLSHGVPALYTPDGVHYYALFGRRKDAATVGLSYGVEFSGNLSSWALSTDTPTVVAQDTEIEAVTVPYPPLVNGVPPQYFHLKVTAQ